MSEPDWQPISTAPKDGTRVPLIEKWRAGPTVVIGKYYARTDAWFTDDGNIVVDPTHWLPLPTPPKET